METKKNNKINSIILGLVILFCLNVFKFVNTQGSEHPLLVALFNMIIILGILIFLYHKKEFIEGQKDLIGQTYLDKYFKRINKD